jgi:hypothetical protein
MADEGFLVIVPRWGGTMKGAILRRGIDGNQIPVIALTWRTDLFAIGSNLLVKRHHD